MKLHQLHTDIQKPERFTYPFCYEPHPLCQLAAKEVQAYISSHAEIKEDADKGKMFGVLVVDTSEGVSFLAAYSGLLAGRNDWDYFVPPVYDAQQPDGYFKTREREISQTSAISHQTSKQMSQDLQLWLFHQYQLLNARWETKDLVDIWQDYYDRPKLRKKFPLPPGGTGDCCAPKLLQYAYQQHLRPVCMAEFWWGQSTKEELRQHLNYYPACRGKCKPILTWMLQGLDVDVNPETLGFPHLEVKTIYEDDALLVVDKPSGMLSIPGRVEAYSVETIMRQRYPDSYIAHRLDMWTSGLLIVAKSLEVYRSLQEQFIKHQVRKRYIAILEHLNHLDKTGTISLPLRPDPMNRPRQVVDHEHGKRAVTDYEFLSPLTSHLSPLQLVALYPQTGRTHQLRIHCAHPEGLGSPIKGDELYGTKADRLYLHAEQIWFRHPVTGEDMHLISPAPFL
ncbi:MAG: RluA family pseudouridine synthase [Prevotella sp.]|nr:RluA family pseudouridine synthase [Prevotella sp.]